MLPRCQQSPTKGRENAGEVDPAEAAQRVSDPEVRNSAVQPEADELSAALASETDADEYSSVTSELEGASDDGSQTDWPRVFDPDGGICSICCTGVTTHCPNGSHIATGVFLKSCPLDDLWFHRPKCHHTHCQSCLTEVQGLNFDAQCVLLYRLAIKDDPSLHDPWDDDGNWKWNSTGEQN